MSSQAAILDAARKVFVRRGTAGARMQEIAEEAGVNQALLHYYFRTKAALADAVFREMASRLLPAIGSLLSSDTSLEDKVERVVALYLDAFSANPFLPGYLLSELHHHPERVQALFAAAAGMTPDSFARPIIRKLNIQIDERVRAGSMRRIAAEQFAVNLVSLCVFPFAARPLLQVAFGLDAETFPRFIEARRRELPTFFLNALRP